MRHFVFNRAKTILYGFFGVIFGDKIVLFPSGIRLGHHPSSSQYLKHKRYLVYISLQGMPNGKEHRIILRNLTW